MYKKILIPTDGSALATAAARAGVEFAAQCRAEVIGVYVAPEYHYPVSVQIIPPAYPSEDEYRTAMARTGEGHLAEVRADAAAAGLEYTGVVAYSDHVAQQIVRLAQAHDCDLIFIGSHGRSGLGQILLGSVTAELLKLCDIPVLVYRLKKTPATP